MKSASISLLVVAVRLAVVEAVTVKDDGPYTPSLPLTDPSSICQGRPACSVPEDGQYFGNGSAVCCESGAVCTSGTPVLSERCCPASFPYPCNFGIDGLGHPNSRCTDDDSISMETGACPSDITPAGPTAAPTPVPAGPTAAPTPATDATKCDSQGIVACCSPVWSPTTPATSTTQADYPDPPDKEFTCKAGYTAVAQTGEASKCSQTNFGGYDFPGYGITGQYECYTESSVPPSSCLGSAVSEFDEKAIKCVDNGQTWQYCVQLHTQFLCTDNPNCKQIFVDRFNAAAALCGSNCLSTTIEEYNGYCAVHLAASDPCFAADTTTACKLVGDVTAAEARRQCYDETKGADAELVLMKNLAAGDVVLAADASGVLSLERVIVNQHKANPLASALLELRHSAGVLALTPDHVLLVDGAFGPARDATPGSTLKLADGTNIVVERVTKGHGAVINPLTASGTIVAGGVIASSHPEWTFAWAGKVPFPLFYGLAAAFPTTTQGYYDAVLEPLFDALGANLRPSALGASALVAPLALADVAAALGLGLFAGAAPAALAALTLGVVTLRSRKA